MMGRMLICFILSFTLSIGSPQPIESIMEDQQDYINKMARNLQVSAFWMIENGIDTYHRQGKEAIFKKLLREWGVQQWVDPIVGGRYIAMFRIKARQMNADIQCLSRICAEDKVFEYWLIQFSGPEWGKSPVGEERHCLFVITEANGIEETRAVIHQSNVFFPSYEISENLTLDLPLDDLQLLYDMRAWRFAESYGESDLKNWEVVIDSNGDYKRIPAN